MGREVGIDLGTTNSVVSYIKEGKIKTLQFGRSHTVPSVVYFKSKNDRLYGEDAKSKGLLNPQAMVKHFKSKMGDTTHKFNIRAENGEQFQLSAKEVAKIFLNYLIDTANRKLMKDDSSESIDDVVITVPAKFNPTEKSATKWAAKQNNVNARLAFEPTAAAIAYQKDFEAGEKILIYDFGGGTFDVSIIEAKNGFFKEISTGGDKHLGGNTLTLKIVKSFLERAEDELEILMPLDPNDFNVEDFGLTKEHFEKNYELIFAKAEEVKLRLSEDEEYEDKLDLFNKDGDLVSLEVVLSKKGFEYLVKKDIQRTIEITQMTIEDAKYQIADISTVVLAGGSSIIPLVKEKLSELFGAVTINSDADPSTLISHGAAILADKHFASSIEIKQNVQNDIGVKVSEGSSINKFDLLIKSGENLPCRVEKEYSLVEDNQQTLEIEIYERDIKNYPNAKRTMDDGIEHFDELVISDLPPMKKNEVKIIVAFEMEEDGSMELVVELKDNDGNLITNGELRIQTTSNLE